MLLKEFSHHVKTQMHGIVQKKSYYSTTCNRQKDVNILLPPNYDPNKKYPVMYIMHGYYEGIDRMLTTMAIKNGLEAFSFSINIPGSPSDRKAYASDRRTLPRQAARRHE